MGDRIVIMNGGAICQVGTPLEVYDRPANLFVAGFIGSPPMNFFEGELAPAADGKSGESVQARLAGGVVLSLPRPDLAGSAGRKVVLGIRPEHIQLGAGRPGATVPATIEVVEPLGHRVVVTARNAAGPFQLETDIHAGAKPGATVELAFDVARAFLFDRQTEGAL